MATNYPGPYELRYNYRVESINHQQRFNLDLVTTPIVGQLFGTINCASHDTTTNPLLSVLVGLYKELWADVYITTESNLVSCELWKYEPETFDATFISIYAIARDGDVAGTTPLASQAIMTFRTAEGNSMRATFMESGISPAPTVVPPYPAAWLALANHFLSATTPYLGRDTSRPAANVALYPGQNERTFKKRNR